MSLNIDDGAACFIDANIFYYHFVETPLISDACTKLLERVALGRVTGYTSSHVISEAIHKIMLAEVAAKFGLSRAGLVNWLQHHPDRIEGLSEFRHAAQELSAMSLSFLPIDLSLFQEAVIQSTQCGLLTNDAIVAALVQRHHLLNLATNDDDFDRVTGITIWKPR